MSKELSLGGAANLQQCSLSFAQRHKTVRAGDTCRTKISSKKWEGYTELLTVTLSEAALSVWLELA